MAYKHDSLLGIIHLLFFTLLPTLLWPSSGAAAPPYKGETHIDHRIRKQLKSIDTLLSSSESLKKLSPSQKRDLFNHIEVLQQKIKGLGVQLPHKAEDYTCSGSRIEVQGVAESMDFYSSFLCKQAVSNLQKGLVYSCRRSELINVSELKVVKSFTFDSQCKETLAELSAGSHVGCDGSKLFNVNTLGVYDFTYSSRCKEAIKLSQKGSQYACNDSELIEMYKMKAVKSFAFASECKETLASLSL